MTEAEWLVATDALPMIGLLERTASDRKLRLFAAACCRLFWDWILDTHCRGAVEMAERVADSGVTVLDAERARASAWRGVRSMANNPNWAAFHTLGSSDRFSIERFRTTNLACVMANIPDLGDAASEPANLLRCVLGNPFRPVILDPAWRTSTVLALAEGIYADRAFDRLPILADALQEVGCDHAGVLDHCRGPGPHARGCWVVDLALGKS